MFPDGRQRVVIEGVSPLIDGGRFPIKRVIREGVTVEADIFADGHDLLSSVLLFRAESAPQWTESPMRPLVNDRWRGEFSVGQLGLHYYTLIAWIDRFRTWRRDFETKSAAGMNVAVELQAGAALIEDAAENAPGPEAAELRKWAALLRRGDEPGLVLNRRRWAVSI